MQLDKNKIIFASVVLALVVIAVLVTMFAGKPKKLAEGNFSFAKLTDNTLNYFDKEKKVFSELNLSTMQVAEKRSIDNEILAVDWSKDASQAILTIAEGDLDYFSHIDLKGDAFNKLNENITAVSWSPNGDKIIYLSQTDTNEFFISNPDGTDAIKVFTLDEDFEPGDSTFSLSADSTKIALTIAGTDVGPSDNYLIDLTTNEIKLLPAGLNGPVGKWANDSTTLLSEVFGQGTQTYSWATYNISTNNIRKINFTGSLNWTDNNQYLVGTDGKAVYKFNSNSLRKTKPFKGYKDIAVDNILTVDGETIYFLSGNTLYRP